eukprot:6076819-Alexandrium_andersonii.AAC.1
MPGSASPGCALCAAARSCAPLASPENGCANNWALDGPARRKNSSWSVGLDARVPLASWLYTCSIWQDAEKQYGKRTRGTGGPGRPASGTWQHGRKVRRVQGGRMRQASGQCRLKTPRCLRQRRGRARKKLWQRPVARLAVARAVWQNLTGASAPEPK